MAELQGEGELARIARLVRVARTWADNMSQEELADAIDYDVSTIKRLERGDREKVRRGELVAIAVACGLPTTFFDQPAGELVMPARGQDQLDALANTLGAIRDAIDEGLARYDALRSGTPDDSAE